MKTLRLMTIVGARPQFIKAAMVSRAIVAHNRSGASPQIREEIVHTGQHYDENMSEIFFRQMHIPEPAVNLNVGSGSHGEMTGRMLEKIEQEIMVRQPDCVLVYGDTDSTLAGSLAAAKLQVPIAHVEAGLRSFNRRMPEEINRIVADHVSSLLFCPTQTAVTNLAKEGITHGVHHVGDVMYDAALLFAEIAERESAILGDLGLSSGEYLLATVHRAENTDDPERFGSIMAAFQELTRYLTIVFPIHPRARSKLSALPFEADFQFPDPNMRLVHPVSFLDMIKLEKHSRCILTDSGGVQKEAYFHGVPCVTLRDETEWVETVNAGWNQLVGADPEKIIEAVKKVQKGKCIEDYGAGNSAEIIITFMLSSAN